MHTERVCMVSRADRRRGVFAERVGKEYDVLERLISIEELPFFWSGFRLTIEM